VADTDAETEASQGDDGIRQTVKHQGHSMVEVGTSYVNKYECEHGDNTDEDEEL
jgi:hypothetical protein